MLFKDKGWHPAGAVVAGLAARFWRILNLAYPAHQADRGVRLFHALPSGCSPARSNGSPCCMGFWPDLPLASWSSSRADRAHCVLCSCWLHDPSLAERAPVLAFREETLAPLLAGGAVATVLAAGPIILSFLFVEALELSRNPSQQSVQSPVQPAGGGFLRSMEKHLRRTVRWHTFHLPGLRRSRKRFRGQRDRDVRDHTAR